MVSTPNNSCVSLDFETISEDDDVVGLAELADAELADVEVPDAELAELPDAGGEGGEEDAVEAVAEIVDEFWNRNEDDEGEHERTLVAETIDERTPQQGTTRKRISEVFLDQHQQSTTFSIPLRLVFISGRGVPKMKDAKKIRQKTKKRRW